MKNRCNYFLPLDFLKNACNLTIAIKIISVFNINALLVSYKRLAQAYKWCSFLLYPLDVYIQSLLSQEI